jgi:hypothetical protein
LAPDVGLTQSLRRCWYPARLMLGSIKIVPAKDVHASDKTSE